MEKAHVGKLSIGSHHYGNILGYTERLVPIWQSWLFLIGALPLLLITLVMVVAPSTAHASVVRQGTVSFLTSSSSPFAVPAASRKNTNAGYDTWIQVAQSADRALKAAESSYSSGNTAGAASDFMSAYNTNYVASNLASATANALGQDKRAALDQQFQSLQNLAYQQGQGSQIAQQVQALSTKLERIGQQLDDQPSLAKPRAYAKEQTDAIQSDRKRLDAAKKHKNLGKGDRTWTQVAQEMVPILDQAYQQIVSGNGAKGSTLVNKAYYQYYEKLGFEKNVMNAISGNRVSQVEYQFKLTRMAMSGGKSPKEVKQLVTQLKSMLVTDAKTLDEGAASKVSWFTRFLTSTFGQAFVVLLREGLEAILVVASIIAYLVKAGYKDKILYIYWGMVAGLVGSGLVALLFTLLFNGSGPQQEILEGVVALIAMCMLLFTSNWMLSKSSVESWNRYIKDKTVAAISKGSVISLSLLSFLAVFREGAETVMFYQAIFAIDPSGTKDIWFGFGLAALLLVVIFVLIRFTSVRIPVRPFFIITSLLMAIMVVIFAGGGVHSLIEGDLVPATYLPSVSTSDWIGLYPYVQTIAAQVIAFVLVVMLFTISLLRRIRQGTGSESQSTARISGSSDLADYQMGSIPKDHNGRENNHEK